MSIHELELAELGLDDGSLFFKIPFPINGEGGAKKHI